MQRRRFHLDREIKAIRNVVEKTLLQRSWVRAGAIILSSVAHLLKIFVKHARITDEAHLFRIFPRINANCDSTPGALHFKHFVLWSFLFEVIHDYFPGLRFQLSREAFQCFERKRLSPDTKLHINSRSGFCFNN